MGTLADGGVACKQAIVDAGGVAAVVAAMGQHTADAKLQRWGCRALRNLACRDAACKQAVVNGGAVVAVVAAMGQHTADAELQRLGRGALWELELACALAARSPAPAREIKKWKCPSIITIKV